MEHLNGCEGMTVGSGTESFMVLHWAEKLRKVESLFLNERTVNITGQSSVDHSKSLNGTHFQVPTEQQLQLQRRKEMGYLSTMKQSVFCELWTEKARKSQNHERMDKTYKVESQENYLVVCYFGPEI